MHVHVRVECGYVCTACSCAGDVYQPVHAVSISCLECHVVCRERREQCGEHEYGREGDRGGGGGEKGGWDGPR